jgi:hypothetical protein
MRGRAWALCALTLLALLAIDARPAAADQLSDTDIAKILASGGFQTASLITGIEIVLAESGGNTTARNSNTDGSVDRGMWQINSVHASVTDACADDPVCATKYAFQLSRSGTYWKDWVTYNTGAYQRFSARAHAAVSSLAPGCDFLWDSSCPVKLAWQGVVGAVQALPVAANGLPSLPGLPSIDPGKLIAQAIAEIGYAADAAMLKSFEGLWNAMLAGEDNIGGKESWAGAVVFDLTPVKKAWGIALAIAAGSSLLTLVFLIAVLWLMLSGGARHESARLLVRVLGIVIVMSASFFLIAQVIEVDNALVGAINSGVALELRQLPAYQGLGLKDPSSLQQMSDIANALILTAGVLILIVEMFLVTALYIVRVIVIVALVVSSPFWILAGVLPGGLGVTVYCARLLLATIFMKFVNALIFGAFLLLAASAQGVFNVLLLAGLLFVMLLVPGTLFRAMAAPHPLVMSAHETLRGAVTYAPLRAGAGAVWGGLRARFGRAA